MCSDAQTDSHSLLCSTTTTMCDLSQSIHPLTTARTHELRGRWQRQRWFVCLFDFEDNCATKVVCFRLTEEKRLDVFSSFIMQVFAIFLYKMTQKRFSANM